MSDMDFSGRSLLSSGTSSFLAADAECLPEDLFMVLYDWNIHLHNESRDLIDVLDEAATTDQETWSSLVAGSVELVQELMDWFVGCFTHQCFNRLFEPDNPQQMLYVYRSWAFGARLTVCLGRLYRWNPTEIENHIQGFSNFLDETITSALALLELRTARDGHQEEISRIEAALDEHENDMASRAGTEVDLDDIARPFVVEKASKSAEQPEACLICTFELSDDSNPVTLDACGNKHVFCHDCLAQWIAAGQHNSLLCPMCRTAMGLPAPDRRSADEVRNLQSEVRMELLRAQDLYLSLANAIDSIIALGVEVRRLRPVTQIPSSLITGAMGFGVLPVEGDQGDVHWELGNSH